MDSVCTDRFAQSPPRASLPNIVSSDDDDDDDGGGYDSSSEDVNFENSISAIDEFYIRMIEKETRLLLETTYSLDYTTYVVLGVSPVRDFTPVITLHHRALGSIDDQAVRVTISLEDWFSVIEYIIDSMEFLSEEDVTLTKEPRMVLNITIAQQRFLNRNYIEVKVDDKHLYLKPEAALTLITLTPIINSHLHRLKHLDLHATYIKLLHLSVHSSSSIDRFKALTCLLDPSSESAMLELIYYNSSKIYNDYAARANPNTTETASSL